MDKAQYLEDARSDDPRPRLVRVQLVAKVLVPQTGADLGQRDFILSAILGQPLIVIIALLVCAPGDMRREPRFVHVRDVAQDH